MQRAIWPLALSALSISLLSLSACTGGASGLPSQRGILGNGVIGWPFATNSNSVHWVIKRTIEVSATQEWQNTGISVNTGDRVAIRYLSGQWTIFQGFDPMTDGNGQAGRPETCRLMPQANLGSLIGRVGAGAPFSVGNGVTKVSSSTGGLQLSINDCPGQFGDNGGSLTVDVVITASEGVGMGLVIFVGYLFIVLAGVAGCGLLLRGLGILPEKYVSSSQVGQLWGLLIVGLIVGFLLLLLTGQILFPT